MSIADKLTTIAENEQKVYDAGKKSQYDEFWDTFQNNGKRNLYDYAFTGRGTDYSYTPYGVGGGWVDKIFKPKYNMQPLNAHYMFYRNEKLTNIVNCGVDIDFSNSTNMAGVFYGCGVTALGVISVVSAISLQNIFAYCTSLVTIEKLILKEDGSNTFTTSFDYCSKLENIAIEGKIGQNISFSSCKVLTYESLMGEKGIINALKDYSGTSTTRTLSLHATAKAKLTESDIAEITQKGWTLA